jgi:prefoldin subunit 5
LRREKEECISKLKDKTHEIDILKQSLKQALSKLELKDEELAKITRYMNKYKEDT